MKKLLTVGFFLFAFTGFVSADPLPNPIAVMAGLDKIMGLTTAFEVKIGKERQFGSLIVKADVCNTRPITEDPKTVAFIEVDEILTDKSRKRIFSGWMFAESPGLNAVEHPLYDVWLVGCKDPNAPPPPIEQAPDASTLQNQINNNDKEPLD